MPIKVTRSTAALQYANANRARYIGTYVYDPSIALLNDPDIYRKMREDPIIAQAIDYRTRAVAQKEWQLAPASEDPRDVYLAAFLEWVARKPVKLTRALRNMGEAFWKGSTWTHMGGETQRVALPRKLQGMDYKPPTGEVHIWYPTQLTDVDRRMFRQRIDKSDDGKINVSWTMSPTSINRGNIWIPEGDGWDTNDYVIHKHDNRHSSLNQGMGEIDSVYWYYVAKTVALREGLQGLERWAQGWVVFTMDAKAAGDTQTTSLDYMQGAITELETHTGRKILGVNGSDTVDVKDGPGTGHQIVQFFLDYLDRGITRRLAGSLIPLGGGADVGSNARGEVEERTGNLMIQGDEEDLSETLNEQYIGRLIDVNRSAIHALGLEEAEPPTWEFTTTIVEDPVKNMEVIRGAAEVGIKLDEDDVYKKTGLKKPAEGKEMVLTPPAPAQGGFFGGP